MTATRTKGRIFISHSHQDDELARDLAPRVHSQASRVCHEQPWQASSRGISSV
jgi:hypothetical protein